MLCDHIIPPDEVSSQMLDLTTMLLELVEMRADHLLHDNAVIPKLLSEVLC